MSSTADTDDVIEVEADGLAVRKTFAADEFPVPAMRFEIESTREEQVSFRISETIPDSFPMDKVGFHPDYHSDDWTAFQDNHVEFTGTVDPKERLITVYGIRIDDESEANQFLTEPEIIEFSTEGESDSGAEEVDDEVIGNIVSDDRNQAVKDMISGESESVPGLEDNTDSQAVEATSEASDVGAADNDDFENDVGELDLNLGDVDPEPEPVADDEPEEDETPDIDLGFEEDEIPGPSTATPDEAPGLEIDLSVDEDGTEDVDADESAATADVDEPEIELDLEAAAEAVDGTDESGGETDGATVGKRRDDSATSDDADVDTATSASDSSLAASSAESTVEGSVATRLASEIRNGEVDDDDLETLRSELDFDLEPTGSDIAKVEHLQSRVEEVAAYVDALEQFLDENGTGKQLIENIQADLERIEDGFDAFDDRLDDVETGLETVESDVAAVESDVSTVEDDLTGVAADVSDVEETVDDLTDDVTDLTDDVADLGDDIEGVEDDLETVEDDLETVESDVETLEGDLDDVRSDVTDIQEWRDQLGSMFSE